jgi:hypothetical protein
LSKRASTWVELIEDHALLTAKVVQPVNRDVDAAGEPAVRGVELDEARDLASRADALARGVDPQCQEDP